MAQIIIAKRDDIHEFPFADEVHDMADFVKENSQILGPDIMIICQELQVGTTDKSRRIDFLSYDTGLNQVAIVELKNQIADEKVLLQTLRYANWIRNNPDSVRYQIKKHNLDIPEDEIDLERVKVLIVAPKINRALVELCQYITAFDFEFIQLQRFKDEKGEVYAITDIVEFETSGATPSKPQGKYDIEWFESQGVRPKQIKDLKEGINKLETICSEQEWDLSVRYVKWSVRFQNPSGRNAFFISLRKTQKHYLRLCLGPDFIIDSVDLKPEIKKGLTHAKKLDRWWTLPLDSDHVNDYVPLLKVAYENLLK